MRMRGMQIMNRKGACLQGMWELAAEALGGGISTK
jgi:hypothetical protein